MAARRAFENSHGLKEKSADKKPRAVDCNYGTGIPTAILDKGQWLVMGLAYRPRC